MITNLKAIYLPLVALGFPLTTSASQVFYRSCNAVSGVAFVFVAVVVIVILSTIFSFFLEAGTSLEKRKKVVRRAKLVAVTIIIIVVVWVFLVILPVIAPQIIGSTGVIGQSDCLMEIFNL